MSQARRSSTGNIRLCKWYIGGGPWCASGIWEAFPNIYVTMPCSSSHAATWNWKIPLVMHPLLSQRRQNCRQERMSHTKGCTWEITPIYAKSPFQDQITTMGIIYTHSNWPLNQAQCCLTELTATSALWFLNTKNSVIMKERWRSTLLPTN